MVKKFVILFVMLMFFSMFNGFFNILSPIIQTQLAVNQMDNSDINLVMMRSYDIFNCSVFGVETLIFCVVSFFLFFRKEVVK